MRLFRLFARPTLRQQVLGACEDFSWPADAARDAADAAVELVGSNLPLSHSQLEDVLSEVCRSEG